MKTLSNKAFNKVIKMMANAPMTVERLSSILDANKDESIDAYFFGRLDKVTIKDREALQDLLTKRVQQYMCKGDELQSVEVKGVAIISVGKIEVGYTYTYAHIDEARAAFHRSSSCTFLATDDEIDGIFDFVYKD